MIGKYNIYETNKYNYVLTVPNNISIGNYKLKVIGKYVDNGNVISEKDNTLNFSVNSLLSLIKINCNDVSIKIGDTYQLNPSIHDVLSKIFACVRKQC
jgi:hypothetical protein